MLRLEELSIILLTLALVGYGGGGELPSYTNDVGARSLSGLEFEDFPNNKLDSWIFELALKFYVDS